MRFLNLLDERLTEERLDTRICFLLYHELLFAPEHERIAHPERFTMMFAPITRTFEKSYADVDYDHGVPEPEPYVRNHYTMPNSLEENWPTCSLGAKSSTATASSMITRSAAPTTVIWDT